MKTTHQYIVTTARTRAIEGDYGAEWTSYSVLAADKNEAKAMIEKQIGAWTIVSSVQTQEEIDVAREQAQVERAAAIEIGKAKRAELAAFATRLGFTPVTSARGNEYWTKNGIDISNNTFGHHVLARVHNGKTLGKFATIEEAMTAHA